MLVLGVCLRARFLCRARIRFRFRARAKVRDWSNSKARVMS
jgi:hypothetical protein